MAAEPLGRMIRRLRLDADLTLERLSEASGISDRALSDIERGAARGPQHRTVLAIATALELREADRAAMVRAARDGRRRAAPSSSDRLPLPPDADHFTGRAVELARITAALTGPRHHPPSPIVVTGPPGYGKTSLAVRAATLVRDALPEQVFVELGGLTARPLSPDAVGTHVVRALSGQQTTSGEVGLLRRLLVDRRVLLVLDDAAYESQVRAVLPSTGPAAVLVTSRRSLAGLDGAERVVLDRMRSEDAQQLLAAIIPPGQRAGADLADLARLCDDVPLALRIAGNRLASRPGWTVRALTARLAVADRRLSALTAGDRGMAAAISPSFAQLGAGAQRLFRRLALVDGSTVGAGLAGALIGRSPWQAEELLDELADLGFVRPTAGDRYALPELLRLYAAAELAHEPLATRAAVRVAADDWLLSTALRAAIALRSGIRPGTPADPVSPGTPLCPESARAWLTDEAENWSAALARVLCRRDPGPVPACPRPHGVHLPAPRPAAQVRTLRAVAQSANRR